MGDSPWAVVEFCRRGFFIMTQNLVYSCKLCLHCKVLGCLVSRSTNYGDRTLLQMLLQLWVSRVSGLRSILVALLQKKPLEPVRSFVFFEYFLEATACLCFELCLTLLECASSKTSIPRYLTMKSESSAYQS